MSTEPVPQFRAALGERDVGCTVTTAADASAALAEVVAEPAVGTPLGIDGVSLADGGVERDPSPSQLRDAATGVTPVRKAIAAHGTIVVPSDAAGSEPVSLYPPRHVGVVRASDLLPDLESTTDWLADAVVGDRESAVLATGASATGDMGALVEGVHGPATVHVVVVEDR